MKPQWLMKTVLQKFTLSTSLKPAAPATRDLDIAAAPVYHITEYPLVYHCFDSKLQNKVLPL